MSKTDNTYVYQEKFSVLHRSSMYDRKVRTEKAKKIIAVIKDYCAGSSLSSLTALDIGCSTGYIASYLSLEFASVTGIDIDREACSYAGGQNKAPNTGFLVSDAMRMPFSDEAFGVVICSHIYEHVPSPVRLLSEIRRVLKPSGICYFAGPNKISLIEPHYGLPLLSILPKRLAHIYLALFRQNKEYYENLLTFRQLERLFSGFEVTDYTARVVMDPVRYNLTELLPARGIKFLLAKAFIKRFSWLSPTFIWILKKR